MRLRVRDGEQKLSNNQNTALVFNVQRYSVHEGPGIRTIIFLKGCPLRCPWCANPEGISPKAVLSHNANLCKLCGRCVARCAEKCISVAEGMLLIDRSRCTLCGACPDACRMDAYKIFGEEKTVKEVLDDVAKDEIFYARSGGGLTVSGGEPLMNPEFLFELLRRAKEEYHLNTAMETTCFAPQEIVRKMLPYLDNVFCDVKLIDSARHQAVVGVPNEQILSNIRMIAGEYGDRVKLTLRMPIIPGFNDDPENIEGTSRFIKSLPGEIPLELLPYHAFGKAKYNALGKHYPLEESEIEPPSKERVEELEKSFERLGVHIIHT